MEEVIYEAESSCEAGNVDEVVEWVNKIIGGSLRILTFVYIIIF